MKIIGRFSAFEEYLTFRSTFNSLARTSKFGLTIDTMEATINNESTVPESQP